MLGIRGQESGKDIVWKVVLSGPREGYDRQKHERTDLHKKNSAGSGT